LYSDYVQLAGWEVIYDFLNHVLGIAGKFNGVPMHIGHFRAHVDKKISECNPKARCFFDPVAWREFIQGGVAAKLQGLPSSFREPCCSLQYIGGDGTAIGVPLGNAKDVSPVWQPPGGLREPVRKWGRLQRCAIGNEISDVKASEKKAAREFIQNVTSGSVTASQIRETRDDLDEVSPAMPEVISKLLETWFTFDRHDDRWDSIRHLLRACSCQDSLCGIVTVEMVPYIETITSTAMRQQPFSDARDLHAWRLTLDKIAKQGMGPEIVKALEACRSEFLEHPATGKHALITFVAFLTYIGNVCKLLRSPLQFTKIRAYCTTKRIKHIH